MSRVLRKTAWKEKNQKTHVFGWVAVILGLLLFSVPTLFMSDQAGPVIGWRTIVIWAAVVVILVTLIFEDVVNGYMAQRKMLPGMEKGITVFTQEGYTTTAGKRKSQWRYDAPNLIVETSGYFVFVFTANHAQIYDKKGISKGTVEDFRKFIEEMTDKKIQMVQ